MSRALVETFVGICSAGPCNEILHMEPTRAREIMNDACHVKTWAEYLMLAHRKLSEIRPLRH